jgi:tetratricopeptide (TPR) repeat protein
MRYSFAAFILIFSVAFSAAAQSSTEMARADSLFQNYHEKEALVLYNDILDENPQNFKALWRSSLLYARIGNRLKDSDEKEDFFINANKRADRALQVDPTHTQSNLVKSIAMGQMALIGGTRDRVAATRDIKKYAERSLKADSTNPGPWHVLGIWNYEVSDLNFAERMAANVLFGGIPDGASLENAVNYIEKAIELNPDFLLYYYDLARSYKEMGKDSQAIASCQKALQKPTVAPDDDKIKQDCRELIDDLK